MTERKTRKKYTKEFKASVLKRLSHPSNETVVSLADELNISRTTIYQWVRTNNDNRKNDSINLKSKLNWSSQDKFHIFIETATFSEIELAE